MLLDARADVNAKGESGTALTLASQQGRSKKVQILHSAGADINAEGEYGTALQVASFNGGVEVVQVLLDVGAQVNAKGRKLGSAIQAASMENNRQIKEPDLQERRDKIIQILLERGPQ